MFARLITSAAAALAVGLAPAADESPTADESPSADKPRIIKLRETEDAYAQEPLPALRAAAAYVCLGGFGDEVGGIVAHEAMRLRRTTGAPVAYYHWDGDEKLDREAGLRLITDDLLRFAKLNPQADLIIIGHSMGGSSGLMICRKLLDARCANADGQGAPRGRICLITLDPVDASVSKERPEGLDWWGNAYVENSQSMRDFIPEMGGRWRHCDGADLNICFDGRSCDEYGRAYIHDTADAQLYSRGSAKHSLWEALRAFLRRGSAADGREKGGAAEQP